MNSAPPEDRQDTSALQPTGGQDPSPPALVGQQISCGNFPQDLLEITAPALDASSNPPTLDRALTQNEGENLESCEQVIRSGKETFEKVGLALANIRDGRLYRTEYSSFHDYCLKRWGWGRRKADRMISAAGVIRELGPMGLNVANERQARELAALSPQERSEAFREALAQTEGRPIAKVVRQAVQKRLSPPARELEPTPTRAAQTAAAKREMEVAIEDLKVVLENLDASPPDARAMTECADHLSHTAMLLRKLARATLNQPQCAAGGGVMELSVGNVEPAAPGQPVRDPQAVSPAPAYAIDKQEPDGNSAKEPQTG